MGYDSYTGIYKKKKVSSIITKVPWIRKIEYWIYYDFIVILNVLKKSKKRSKGFEICKNNVLLEL